MNRLVNHTALRRIVTEICAGAGSVSEEAERVADNLVTANLMGHDSHGVGMLARYIDCVLSGALKPNTHAKIVIDTGALVVIDGQAGYGQIIGAEAMDVGIERAGVHGVAVVAIRNSFHLCRIGAWAEQCARAGFISMHHTNVIGHKPLVAPFGGAEARYATNPYTVGLPASDNNPMIVLDMATSVVALGKIRVARNKGEPVEEGILLDGHGHPTTDPNVMYTPPFGAVLPFGGHKGGGLALVNELLAGILSGGQTMRPQTTPTRDSIINNMLSIIIDRAKLVDTETYETELDATLGWIKSSKPMRTDRPVLIPGEPERLMRREREVNGIPIDEVTWHELVAAGERVGVTHEHTTRIAEQHSH